MISARFRSSIEEALPATEETRDDDKRMGEKEDKRKRPVMVWFYNSDGIIMTVVINVVATFRFQVFRFKFSKNSARLKEKDVQTNPVFEKHRKIVQKQIHI